MLKWLGGIAAAVVGALLAWTATHYAPELDNLFHKVSGYEHPEQTEH